MSLRLPSRYEDLDFEFRGRLRPDPELLETVKGAFRSMEISGGIRFLPIYGQSGSGKSSAAIELGTHLPDLTVMALSREAVENQEVLHTELRIALKRKPLGLVVVIDQYEEAAASRAAVPTSFVEMLALLDRGELRKEKILFLWLTTSREFQSALAQATSRNRRILLKPDYELKGPSASEWPSIITETFQAHNQDRNLSDYEILEVDLAHISRDEPSLGTAIEAVGQRLGQYTTSLHDLSAYQVVMLWPVTDGLRISRIMQITDARQGYKLDWSAWYRQLNPEDQRQLPLRELNRARLYFDVRLVPIAAADLHPLCKELDDNAYKLHKTYLERIQATHFFSIISGNWNLDTYSPLRERESQRADDARAWYEGVTREPTKLGRRIAKILRELNLVADYEQPLTSPHSKVRADVLVDRSPISPPKVIIELKAYSPENTMPSTICAAVQTTLRRHAQFAGFLQR